MLPPGCPARPAVLSSRRSISDGIPGESTDSMGSHRWIRPVSILIAALACLSPAPARGQADSPAPAESLASARPHASADSLAAVTPAAESHDYIREVRDAFTP